VALHLNDMTTVKILANYLNTHRCDGFYLRFQEIIYILKKDNPDLIDCFKNYIKKETLCCALNVAIERNHGILCLKKILKCNMVTHSHNLYLLLKTSVKCGGTTHLITRTLLKYVTKRMVHYAASENDHVLLSIVLSSLAEKFSKSDVHLVILSTKKNGLKKKCAKILDQYEVRPSSLRL